MHPCIMFLGSCLVLFVSLRASVILLTSLSSSKTEFACTFYDVLMLLVVLFPTSLSLLNSELICRSYGSSCFLECGFCQGPSGSTVYLVVVPLRGLKRQYRSAAVLPAVTPQQYYRWLTRSLPRRFEGSFSVSDCAVPRCGSTALPPR